MRSSSSTTGSSIWPACSSRRRICGTSLSCLISTWRRSWCCRVSRACLPRWTTTVRRCPMCAFTQRARAAGWRSLTWAGFGRGRAPDGARRCGACPHPGACWNGRIWRARSVLPLPSPRRGEAGPARTGASGLYRAPEGSGIDGADAAGHRAH